MSDEECPNVTDIDSAPISKESTSSQTSPDGKYCYITKTDTVLTCLLVYNFLLDAKLYLCISPMKLQNLKFFPRI